MKRSSRYLVGVGVMRNELAREVRSELAVTGVVSGRGIAQHLGVWSLHSDSTVRVEVQSVHSEQHHPRKMLSP